MPQSPLAFIRKHEKQAPAGCLICGEEIQLVEEVRSGISRLFPSAQRDYVDLEKLQDEDFFLGQSKGLFAGDKDTHLYQLSSNGKPPANGLALIDLLCERVGPPDCLMISIWEWDYKYKKAAWFKKLSEQIPTVLCNRLSAQDARPWLQHWIAQQKIQLSPPALDFLAVQSEGNLFVAKQAIIKLALSGAEREYDVPALRAVMVDGARHDILDLSDAIYAGDPVRALAVLQQLHERSTAIVLIQWGVLSILNNIIAVKNGAPAHAWGRQQQSLQSLAGKINENIIYRLIRQIAHADRAIKGVANREAMAILSGIVLYLAGRQNNVKISLPYF